MEIEAATLTGWWRWSEYILDGSQIRPAPDALLERYDPWSFAADVPTHRGGGMLDRPYLALIELADALSEVPRRSRARRNSPTPLNWCREHGLLGLLLLDLRQITLYPRWDRADPGEEDVWPQSRTYSRTANGWVENGGLYAAPEGLALSPAERKMREGAVAEKKFWDETWDQPGLLTRDPATGRFRHQDLAVLADYFPAVRSVEREVYRYPMPLSDEFWSQYAEDADQFQDRARRFAQNVRMIGRYQAGSPLTEEGRSQLKLAVGEMQILGADTVPALAVTGNGKIHRHWAPTSLIGAYAWMVLSDAANGLLNVCVDCGRVFVSSAGRARFCSPRCRKRSLQRDWRGRKAAREEGESESIREV